MTAIKSFFAWLESTHIYHDIAHTIHGPKKIAGQRKKSLSPQQVKRLFKTIKGATLADKRDYALITLMIETGLRSVDITNIIRGDIANCCGAHVLWIAAKENKGKDKDIHLPGTLFNAINDYLAARKSISDTDPLFASHSKRNFGQPLTLRSVTRIIKKRLNNAELNTVHISPSSLRLTAIKLKSQRRRGIKRLFVTSTGKARLSSEGAQLSPSPPSVTSGSLRLVLEILLDVKSSSKKLACQAKFRKERRLVELTGIEPVTS